PLLQLSEAQILQKLNPRSRQNTNGPATNSCHYVVLKKQVTLETWQQIQSALKNLSFNLDDEKLSKTDRTYYRDLRQNGVFAEATELRVYPYQALAAPVLGFVGSDDREVKGRSSNDTTGQEGIERTFNPKLTGVRGWRVTENDGHQREVVPMREQDVEPQDGLNVVLTSDAVVKQIVEA